MSDLTPPQKISIFDWFQHHMSYRAKVLVVIFLIIFNIVLANYVRDAFANHKADEKEIETLKQKFQQEGNSAVSGNTVATQKDLNAQATTTLPPELINYMRQQNSTIQSLTTALGSLQDRVSQIQNMSQPDFTQHRDQKTGALSNFKIDESRVGSDGKPLPPITSIHMTFDPSKPDPNVAFRGTYWVHNREDFAVNFGQWQEKKGGGYKTTVSLKRSVYQRDPTDSTKFIAVGTEDIPIQDAETSFSPSVFNSNAGSIGRWTAMLGVGKTQGANISAVSSYQPFLGVDYRITNKYGVFGAVQNKTGAAGLSIRF